MCEVCVHRYVCVPGTVAALIGLQSTKTSGRLVRTEAEVCERIDRISEREREGKGEGNNSGWLDLKICFDCIVIKINKRHIVK